MSNIEQHKTIIYGQGDLNSETITGCFLLKAQMKIKGCFREKVLISCGFQLCACILVIKHFKLIILYIFILTPIFILLYFL